MSILGKVKMMRKWWLIALLGILLLAIGAIALAAGVMGQSYEVVAGARGYPIAAGCEIIVFGKGLQPITTVAFACPGTDLVRLWPLPVVKPWFEDWIDGIVGVNA